MLQTLIYTTFFTIIELTRYYKFSSGFSTDEFLCSLRVNTHTHTHTHTHTNSIFCLRFSFSPIMNQLTSDNIVEIKFWSNYSKFTCN